jgi:hypothetical protein
MLVFRKLKNTIAGTINGEPFNAPRTPKTEAQFDKFDDKTTSEEVHDYVKQCHNEEVAGSNEYLLYNPVKNEYFLTYKGYRSDKPIPAVLVTFIENSYDKDIDFMPIVKAWARLLTNPRYSDDMAYYFSNYLATKYIDSERVEQLKKDHEYTHDVAVNMSTYQDIAITKEGLLATYKVADMVTWEYEMVKNKKTGEYEKQRNRKYKVIPAVIDKTTGHILEEERIEKPEFAEEYLFTPSVCKNGDKFYSGNKIGYVYEIGKQQYLPKKALRNLQHTFGGGGLYIGGLHYIDSYSNENNYTLTCFVDPADIISFQSEGNAIRVDALFPNNIWKEEVKLGSVYHSSDYGKKSEARIAKLIKEAVAEDINLKEAQATYSGVNLKEELEDAE